MNRIAKAAALVSILGAATLANAGTVGPQNFNVTVNLTSSCALTAAPTDVAFTYTSFQAGPSVATPSSFTVKCTNLRPYTMALDAAGGTVIGLAYTIALTAAGGTGTGVDQTYGITGNMVGGQSGNCAAASCAGTDVRTLTITYYAGTPLSDPGAARLVDRRENELGSRNANERRPWPSLRKQGAIALALLAGGTSTPFASLPLKQSFNVRVTLQAPAEAEAAQCSTRIEPGTGRKITVNCSTATTVSDIPRYLLHVYRAGEWITVDGQMGTGTLTSWRIVHVANREYLEMMVGW
jgi:hypothetical protein